MRRIVAWLGWFGGLIMVWLVLVGTVQDVERVAGLCAAALAATAAEIVRSQGLLRFRVEWRWVRRAWKGVLSALLALGLASFALYRRRIPTLLRSGARRLEAVHDGVTGDYVTWLVAGAAALGGLFAVLIR